MKKVVLSTLIILLCCYITGLVAYTRVTLVMRDIQKRSMTR